MVNDWRKVKRKLDEETEHIRFSPPSEVLKIFKYGIIETGQGSYGQYFTTMVFVEGDCRALCYYHLANLIVAADEPSFTLEQLKYLTWLNLMRAKPVEFLGSCGLEKLWKFTQEVIEAVKTVKTKEEYKQLMNSLLRYVALLHGWIHHYFPWYLGEFFPQKTREELEEMARLASI